MERYKILGPVGEGAHGLVLKARDTQNNNQEVALKKVFLKRVEDGIPITMLREVKVLQQLNHPYVIFIFIL